MKKILSAVMAIVMIISIMSVSAYAVGENSVSNDPYSNIPASSENDFTYDYTPDGLGIIITSYIGEMYPYVDGCRIPDMINFYPVVGIANGAFSGADLGVVIIPQYVTKIDTSAFQDSYISNIILNEGLEIIEASAFANTMITSINIPSTTTTIADDAFINCQEFMSFTVAPNNPKYYSYDDILYDKISNTCKICPAHKTGPVRVKDGCTIIGNKTFMECNFISQITLPASVNRCGSFSFRKMYALEYIIVEGHRFNFPGSLWINKSFTPNFKAFVTHPDTNTIYTYAQKANLVVKDINIFTYDLNYDDVLDVLDYQCATNICLAGKNSDICTPEEYDKCDVMKDGVVDVLDLIEFRRHIVG